MKLPIQETQHIPSKINKNTSTEIDHSKSAEHQRQKEDCKSSQREKTDFLKMKKSYTGSRF